MDDNERLLDQARLVLARLERLSADSIWAHRASGMRGSLLRCVEDFETGGKEKEQAARLAELVRQGTTILENAAREIRVPEKSRFQ